MANKSHLYFRNPQEGVVVYKQPKRYLGEIEEEDKVKNYTPLKKEFRNSIDNFFKNKKRREQKRNLKLNVPAHIDCIEIEFFDYFDTANFENKYIADFGLSPIRYTNFNKKVLFAIADKARFDSFIEELEKFIATEDHTRKVEYNTNIKFIRKFEFLSTKKIILFDQIKQLVVLKLIENADLFTRIIRPVRKRLIYYLRENNISFSENLSNSTIELVDVNQSVIAEIADNFDIIQSINSHLSGIIRPSPYNLPERTFGFSITNANEELPVIGIIDTGISDQTPLATLMVNQNSSDYDLTGTSVFSDNANHGTGVAAMASLGKSLYPHHRGSFKADAKLLSIKVLDGHDGPLPSKYVIDLIRKANREFQVKIFVLTIAYIDFKKYNSSVSDYAFILDLLAAELDILIFISVGNNTDLSFMNGQRVQVVDYPDHFLEEKTNLCIPAESMNNISVGAVADNLENSFIGITPDKTFPAIYTRKFHLNFEDGSLSKTQKNKHLFKPDILHCGGNYDTILDIESDAAMKHLSAGTGLFFERNIGTSFSAPMCANLAARIIKQYPQLDMQSVKALIINSAKKPSAGDIFQNIPGSTLRHLLGHGNPEDNTCLFSNENQVTFVIEDSIQPEYIKSFPLKLPEYLNDLNTEKNVLEITATLCFKFKPLPDNQLAYCPVHITFGMARNLELNEYLTVRKKGKKKLKAIGINENSAKNAMVNTWAQDYYYKAKLLSNSQKILFRKNKHVLSDESNIFKIVIHSKFHKLLNAAQRQEYDIEYPFSLVVTVKELPVEGVNTGRLYDELQLVNILSVINELEAEGEATADM